MSDRDKCFIVWVSLALLMFGLAMMLWDFALGTVIAMPGFLCLLAIARPTASTSQEQEP